MSVDRQDAAARSLLFHDAAAVRGALTVAATMDAVREAMIELSAGRVRQHLRSFIGLGEGRTFAIMPAACDRAGVFGAKLVGVFADGTGRKSHEGLVVLFDGDTGAPYCLADAGEVTALRTAAASAVATQALARPDASVLAILGLGRQALEHARAITVARRLSAIRLWGRDPERTRLLARQVSAETGLPTVATIDAKTALRDADIVCMVTASTEPVALGDWIAPGTHVNLVGSSGPGAAEVDSDLVAKARFIVDHREHVLVHGGEFLRAKASGRIDDDHIAGEIGAVLAGEVLGRTSALEVTVYKSLGHAVQDIAATTAADRLIRG